MKKLILASLVALSLTTARAQFFGPEAFGGAFWGSLIGGLAGGNHCNGFSGQWAAVGAGAGFLLGGLVGEARQRAYDDSLYYYPGPYAYAPGPAYYCPAPVYVAPAPPPPAPPPVKVVVRRQPIFTASPAPVRTIPDAPRVPDPPTF